MSPRRPLLRYHGGKWRLAPWLISNFPSHTTYVEPFAGAASVLLKKPRSRGEILNDLEGEVVNLFLVLRSRGERLVRLLEFTPFSRTEYARAIRPVTDPVERARRLIVRSFMGFGSDSFRANRTSGFRGRFQGSGKTTPAYEWSSYPSSLAFAIDRLRGVVIENLPAVDVIRKYDRPDTFFYCDPPYPILTRSACSNGRHCYTHEMKDADHEHLSEVLHSIKGMAIISSYDCPLYSRLYKGWRKESHEALADGAKKRIETIWFSPSIPKGLFQ